MSKKFRKYRSKNNFRQPIRKISFCSELTSLNFKITLYKTRVAFCFRAKKKTSLKDDTDYPKFCVGMPVVRTDGRAG